MVLDFIKNSRRSCIGLDISSKGLTAVSLSPKQKGLTLFNIGFEPFEEDTIQNGLVINTECFVKTLERMVNNHKFDTKCVNIAFPGNTAFIKTITLPNLPEEELKIIVQQESAKYIPFPMNEANIDFQIMENNKKSSEQAKKVDVILVAVSKSAVKNYAELINRADLQLTAVDVAPFAMIRTLGHAGLISDQGSVYISVLIGEETTDIDIIKNGMPVFSNNAPIGKRNVLEAVINSLDVNSQEVNSLLHEVMLIIPGLNMDDLSPNVSKAASAVRNIYNSISSEIQKTIEFYYSQNAGQPEIKNIILGGQGVCIQNIDKYISNRLKIDTVICDSLYNIANDLNYGENLLHPVNIPSLAVSAGLALKGFKG